ncbi:MAG: response regulator [Elusimicrobiota bacterium]
MSNQKTILIVDDEPDVRFVLKTALERGNFATQEAADGLEALEKVKSQTPDAIVLDIMMPKLDGYSVHQKLKEDPRLAQIPVVIITGKGYMKEFLELRKDLEVAAYLEKPFPVALLVNKLKEVLGEGQKGQ